MVKSGNLQCRPQMSKPKDLKEVHFDNPRLTAVGVEALTLEELRAGASPGALAGPQRVDFFHVLLVERGEGQHMVDFIEHELKPGTVLFVRPGQVQQWQPASPVEGTLILMANTALMPCIHGPEMRLLSLPLWSAVARPEPEVFAVVSSDFRRLKTDIGRFKGSDLEVALIQHELLSMLLRLAPAMQSSRMAKGSGREAEVHALFAQALEAGYAGRQSVLAYANRLGFSESTVSRACVAMTGRTAKQLIDERVALEAKRLLVHSEATAAQIGHWLGFTEATNFVKFFRRTAGMTPLDFRARMTAQG